MQMQSAVTVKAKEIVAPKRPDLKAPAAKKTQKKRFMVVKAGEAAGPPAKLPKTDGALPVVEYAPAEPAGAGEGSAEGGLGGLLGGYGTDSD